jgi:hypothetical protein
MTDSTNTPAAALSAATSKDALPDARLSLLGTLHGPDSARAILRHRGRIETVRPGDRIGQTTVAAIGEGVVILSSGGTTTRLAMPGG